MKKNIILLLTILLGMSTIGFSQKKAQPEWGDFAKTINATGQSKMTMIYIYNHPCDLCKTTEETILSDTAVINTMKKNFNAVKFDAASKDEISYKGTTYPYSPFSDTEGINILSIVLLEGKMGYPTFVFLDKDGEKVGNHFPVKDEAELLQIMQYYSSGDYLKTPSYEEWVKKQNK